MFSDWTGRRVAVVGLGIENTPLALFLAQHGAQVTGVDRRPITQLPAAADLAAAGVRLLGGDDGYLRVIAEETFDYVFLTPGMVKDQPEIAAARDAGAVITTQMNLFFSLCKAPIIGITGSSGKSTTTTLIGRILSAGSSRPVFVGGNLNEPLIDRVEEIPAGAWVVLELSSFQLELAVSSPHIAVLLNIFPNHLDVHGSMDKYRQAKTNIFRFQQADRGDVAVFNYDHSEMRSWASQAPAGRLFFGRSLALAEGATVREGWIVLLGPGKERPVMPLDEINIPGEHNVYNILAAAAVADLCGVDPRVIRDVVRQFHGLEHRLETVAEVDGVLYVNDSIATTPDRTVAALSAFDRPIVLIAGGYDKGIPFTQMAEALLSAEVRSVVLVGQTADAIAAELQWVAERDGRRPPVMHKVDTFEAAVNRAAADARPGDVVLLSPGCASYGMFNNFVERGRRFRQLVQAISRTARDEAKSLSGSEAGGV